MAPPNYCADKRIMDKKLPYHYYSSFSKTMLECDMIGGASGASLNHDYSLEKDLLLTWSKRGLLHFRNPRWPNWDQEMVILCIVHAIILM